MSKLFGFILTVGALVVGLFLLTGTEDGKSFTDFFLSAIVDSRFLIVFSGMMLTIFGVVVLLVIALDLSAGHTASKWPKVIKDESLGIFIYVHENGVIIADFGGGTSYKFTRDSFGKVIFVEELYPNKDGIVVAKLD
jgi:hypothetical protein